MFDRIRRAVLLVAASCLAGCSGSDSVSPATSTSPSIPAIAAPYQVTIVSASGSCEPKGSFSNFDYGFPYGGAIPLIQNGAAVTMNTNAITWRFALSGMVDRDTLSFTVDTWWFDPYSGVTTVAGSGIARVQKDRIFGTFTGDIVNNFGLGQRVLTCRSAEHSLVMTRRM